MTDVDRLVRRELLVPVVGHIRGPQGEEILVCKQTKTDQFCFVGWSEIIDLRIRGVQAKTA